ncbi:MAG: hypothetical protein A3G38_02035 [Omnitrophica WOR_2 bacterium RIFCSPLOWO2_12_FULL_51_8]|nr:MAG: hypothetical protein A3G38_02035 [Omnitrophica WOR_2 bacterium RIFCSPLOWO2_12_FULL_51_8]
MRRLIVNSDNFGQAVAEMAIFGSLLLFVFGALIAYIQRFNDQQYAQMEAFRRALEKGSTYTTEEMGNPGASVQFTLVQNRRHSDFSGSFRKGSAQALSASSSVFWAVPKVGEQAKDLIVYRINEDEEQIDPKDFITADEEAENTFEIEQIRTNSSLNFTETAAKQETPLQIVNKQESTLSETINTIIPYAIRNKQSNQIVREGEVLNLSQRLYREGREGFDQGQYKYSSQVPEDHKVVRGKEWSTEF